MNCVKSVTDTMTVINFLENCYLGILTEKQEVICDGSGLRFFSPLSGTTADRLSAICGRGSWEGLCAWRY